MQAGALWYRLRQIDRDGTQSYSDVVKVAAENEASVQRIDVYPQPLASGSRSAMLHFALAASGDVSLRLYDGLGRSAGSLAEGRFEAGTHVLACALPALNPGTYFLTLTLDGRILHTQALQIVR